MSSRQTLRSIDHDPTLLSSATPQQHLGAAVLHSGCNMYPKPHPTPNLGAIPYNIAPAIQFQHARATSLLGLYCSYINKLTIARHHNLQMHQLPAHKTG